MSTQEQRTEYQRRYRKEHKEENIKANKKYRQNHKEAIRERRRKDYQLHKEKRKASQKDFRERCKVEILTTYSTGDIPECVRCKITDIDVLTIDHVNGGGFQERKKLGVGGGGFYLWLKRQGFPKGYQVLCANCNMKKLIREKT